MNPSPRLRGLWHSATPRSTPGESIARFALVAPLIMMTPRATAGLDSIGCGLASSGSSQGPKGRRCLTTSVGIKKCSHFCPIKYRSNLCGLRAAACQASSQPCVHLVSVGEEPVAVASRAYCRFFIMHALVPGHAMANNVTWSQGPSTRGSAEGEPKQTPDDRIMVGDRQGGQGSHAAEEDGPSCWIQSAPGVSGVSWELSGRGVAVLKGQGSFGPWDERPKVDSVDFGGFGGLGPQGCGRNPAPPSCSRAPNVNHLHRHNRP